MSDIDIHFSSEKKKKKTRGRLILGVSLGVALLLLIAGSLYAAQKYKVFAVQDIRIEGNSATASADIINAFKERIRGGSFFQRMLGEENILSWPTVSNEKDIRMLPALISLSLTKDYAKRTISLSAVERTPYGIWCTHQKDAAPESGDSAQPQMDRTCAWFDKDGVIFMPSLHVEGMLIKKVDDYSGRSLPWLSKILPPAQAPHLFEIFALLDAASLPIEEIRFDSAENQEVSAKLKGGPALLFSLRFSPSHVLPVLKDLSSRPDFRQISYIDFRVENRAYYK